MVYHTTGNFIETPYTAKVLNRKFETYIPRKGTARLQFQFICTFMFLCRFKYFHHRSAYSAAGDRSWEYINRSQTHECENWDWGRAVLYLGIHKSKFLCSAIMYSGELFSTSYISANSNIEKCFSFCWRILKGANSDKYKNGKAVSLACLFNNT